MLRRLKAIKPLYLLLVFVPIALGFEFFHADPLFVFIASSLAIVPLAGLMGEATEQVAAHVGAGLGALLNASFGNAAELIIAIMALREGLHDVVKASITGSIIGNILLVLGLSMVAGGLRYKRQRFNPTAAGMGASLLLLSAVGLIVPALFHFTASDQGVVVERELSFEIAVVLFAIYLLSLIFSLKTHRHLFAGENTDSHHGREQAWNSKTSSIVLLIATIGIAVMSELLVGAVEPTATRLGLTQVFVGVILVALVGNAAEHSTAVLVAIKNQMDLALGIAVGSSQQIALFVAPVLVFVSYVFGEPLDLIFTPFEVAAVTMSVLIVGFVSMDGESHWMEGIMLVGVYIILAVAFFFLPA
ncbi:MAG TPA: calcium/proton exchanger [Nitrospiraceae bacterium]|nr:calcium/proton exchanger [Nitrospiraceae bacterium]